MKTVIKSVFLLYFYACVLGRQPLNFAKFARRYQVINKTSQNFGALVIDLIFPGTKWCGAGDIADNYTDLGWLKKLDKCCRTHDHCVMVISPGSSDHGLTNTGSFTRLHCNCDEKFRKCLLATKSRAADTIGNIYFNRMGFQCFKKDYPVTGCLKREGLLMSKCVMYSYNRKGRKAFQWFDVKFYRDDTKWCGPGNLANGFEDLGSERQTDMCCRQHDFCPDSIGAYKTNETLQLTNRAGYSRLSCSCDHVFHDCLKKLSSITAETVRKLYFNFIKTKCFAKDYPVQCVATKGALVKKCLQYGKNNNTEMVYQWVDLRSLR